MVIYYSSTGNSKHVALRLHETYKGDMIDVGCLDKPKEFYLEDNETLFIVTFNCFWGISKHMETFLRKSKFYNVSKITVIITCGGFLGGGDASIETLFSEIGFPKPIIYAITMVTNYSILHNVPSIEAQKKILNRADKVLTKIIQGTQKPYHSNWFVRQFTPKIHVKYENARITSPFNVNSSCISCGLCEKNCPVQAIKVQDNKPLWVLPECDNCLRCLHHCPVEAINYGNSTYNRLRYTYKSYS